MQEIIDGVSDLFSSGIVLFLKNMVMLKCSISEKNEKVIYLIFWLILFSISKLNIRDLNFLKNNRSHN